MAFETVAPLTGNAEGFDIVCSAWKHAAVTKWSSLVTGEVLRASLNIRYKLVLDRMVGNQKLHKNCVVVAAGNLDTDGAITNPMSSAMVSRIVHIIVKPSLPEWLEWAEGAKISSKIVSFLEFKTSMFYTFDADEPAHIYASPRTWEFADRLLKRWNDNVDASKVPLLAGTISEGVTTELRSFLAYYGQLPSMGDIISKPESTPIPNLPGVLYALDGMIADQMDAANIEKVLTYIDRLPAEHIVILFRIALRRNPKIRSNPHFLSWATKNANYLIH